MQARKDAFAAIADPTRRAILDLLRQRQSLNAGEIAAQFPRMSRPSPNISACSGRQGWCGPSNEGANGTTRSIQFPSAISIRTGWPASPRCGRRAWSNSNAKPSNPGQHGRPPSSDEARRPYGHPRPDQRDRPPRECDSKSAGQQRLQPGGAGEEDASAAAHASPPGPAGPVMSGRVRAVAEARGWGVAERVGKSESGTRHRR